MGISTEYKLNNDTLLSYVSEDDLDLELNELTEKYVDYKNIVNYLKDDKSEVIKLSVNYDSDNRKEYNIQNPEGKVLYTHCIKNYLESEIRQHLSETDKIQLLKYHVSFKYIEEEAGYIYVEKEKLINLIKNNPEELQALFNQLFYLKTGHNRHGLYKVADNKKPDRNDLHRYKKVVFDNYSTIKKQSITGSIKISKPNNMQQ